jgi:hypothetical protein
MVARAARHSRAVALIRLVGDDFFHPPLDLVVSLSVVRGGRCGQSGEFRAQFLWRHDCHRRSSSEQMPAHLLHPAGEEAHGQGAIELAFDDQRARYLVAQYGPGRPA